MMDDGLDALTLILAGVGGAVGLILLVNGWMLTGLAVLALALVCGFGRPR